MRKTIHTIARQIEAKNEELGKMLTSPLMRLETNYEDYYHMDVFDENERLFSCTHNTLFCYNGRVYCDDCGVTFEEHKDEQL